MVGLVQIGVELRTKVVSVLDGYSVQFENEDFKTPPDNPWFRATILYGKSFQASMGQQRVFRTPGILEIQVFVPQNEGSHRRDELADIVVAGFRAATLTNARFRVPFVTPVGLSDVWFQTNVSCPFWVDDVGELE